MNELNELEGLTPIEVNSRRSYQNFDIYHDSEKQEFTVSDALYLEHELNNNGFNFHVGNSNVYVTIQPNKDCVSYPGKEGSVKGKKFKSTVTSNIMTKAGLIGSLELERVGEKVGLVYYRISAMTTTEQETEPEVIQNEELV